ncbi:MAG: hypothetical protein K9H14_00660 [Actinomycetia bacterium]|nr:hypothetical protein [Actinomycetes bacterium]
MPNTWKEAKAFKEGLCSSKIKRKLIWKKKIASTQEFEYYNLFLGEHTTIESAYKIYWYLFRTKKRLDHNLRGKKMGNAEKKLSGLSELNKRKFREEENIKGEMDRILKTHKVEDFLIVDILKEENDGERQARA